MAAKRDRRKAAAAESSSLGVFARGLPLVLLAVAIAILYRLVLQPPPARICGSPGGPPVTSPRIQLRDGRHLAYLEKGVPKEKAKYRVIFVHGFDSCRYDVLPVSPELLEEMGIYLLGFDRPGYAESDPNPAATPKSIALDIEELADKLDLGTKFHVVGFSMGGEIVWGCLKYIPHRLAGAALLAPASNYWWSGFPENVSKAAWKQQLPPDQWAVWVAHHAPWLTYWWNTQKFFPCSGVVTFNPALFSKADMKIAQKSAGRAPLVPYIRQQGEYPSLHRDMNIGFGRWEFSPMELDDPFPNKEGTVHLWHGNEDLIVPVLLSRHIAGTLPWIKYHEIAGAGHLFPMGDGMADVIIKSLLLRDKDVYSP